jgi:HEAT repeat protein
VIVLGICAPLAAADDPPMKLAEAKEDSTPWLTSLADGYVRAQRRRQPIFVRFSSASCNWCKKLEQELLTAKVQEELGRWTLVSLDVDRHARDARTLVVGAVPAMRLLTPTGRVAASRDEFMSAKDLIEWLKENHDKAAVLPPDELTADGDPSPAAVKRLVAELKNRDPALREAAVRRLAPYPALAAPAVAEAFAKGALQPRLAALELLREWKAPITDLDPWQPETLKPERLDGLQKWAEQRKKGTNDKRGALTPEERQAARRDLARLVQAPDAEAVAIRERLARHGAALLPDVYAQLQDAPTDQARERLTALRYRLAATNALALAWPGGLERLAATNAAPRHQAVQELVGRATSADEPLLLELFTNPDPLVRELSLRGLRKIAGRQATTALTRLLADPEPNVRAAVLKQLAEKPSDALVPQMREYVGREKDADLVVHAVRVLRGVSSAAAIGCLNELIGHDSWRVRAEVAEALGECLNSHHGSDKTIDALVYTPLTQLLKDKDGFVVGRAVKALRRLNSTIMVDPLVQAAEAHPEIVPEVVDALSYNSDIRTRAIRPLRKFCSNPNAEARAAAIKGLCLMSDEVEAELRTALKDDSSAVRTAAAQALLSMLDSRLVRESPEFGEIGVPPPPPPTGVLQGLRDLFGPKKKEMEKPKEKDKEAPRAPDPDARLLNSLSGAGRLPWMAGLVELLRPMLKAEAPQERVAAAVTLTAFARDEETLPVLFAVAQAEPPLQGKAGAALAWLPWAKREPFFKQLVALKPGPEELDRIIYAMMRNKDKRVLPLLWDLTTYPSLNADLAGTLARNLRELHFDGWNEWDPEGRRVTSAAERKEAVTLAKPRTEAGPELQRVIALAVLLKASPAEAFTVANRISGDANAPAALREDAFRVLLVGRRHVEAVPVAVEGLRHPLTGVRLLALIYLEDELQYSGFDRMRSGAVHLDAAEPKLFGYLSDTEKQAADKLKGIAPEKVRPLLQDADPMVRARAGYLLALLGDKSGLPPLVQYWRDRAQDEEKWALMVTRAVAAVGDDASVPVLEEIYRLYQAEIYTDLRHFFSSVNALKGPNGLRLEKRIRADRELFELIP